MQFIKSVAIVIALFFGISMVAQAQKGGLQVHGGYLMGINNNEAFSPDVVRGGYQVIADARLIGGGMHFLFGGGVGRWAINSGSGFGGDQMTLATGRFGLGITLVEFSRNLRLRTKLVGSIRFIGSVDADKIDNQEFRKVNDSFGGALTGLGLDIGAITVDFEYEHGLINMINQKPDTKINFFSLTAGVFF